MMKVDSMTEEHYNEAISRIEKLMDEKILDNDNIEELDELSKLAEGYEEKHFPIKVPGIKIGDKFRHKYGLTNNMSKTFQVRQTVDDLFIIRTWNKRKKRYDYSIENFRCFSSDSVRRVK